MTGEQSSGKVLVFCSLTLTLRKYLSGKADTKKRSKCVNQRRKVGDQFDKQGFENTFDGKSAPVRNSFGDGGDRIPNVGCAEVAEKEISLVLTTR